MNTTRKPQSGEPGASASAWMKAFYCILLGFGLMNVALFVHPMNPEDFLYLVFSDPLATVLDAQGGDVALFFWGSLLLCLFACFGMFFRHASLHRLILRGQPAIQPGN